MPVATTSGIDTERFELKTLPGGYVVVRRMTYGEYLARREIASRMDLKSGEDRAGGMAGTMQLVNRKVVYIEFASCIVDHNLETEVKGPRDAEAPSVRKLDFSKEKDVDALDPRIAEEIGTYIDQMNRFEEDDEEGN